MKLKHPEIEGALVAPAFFWCESDRQQPQTPRKWHQPISLPIKDLDKVGHGWTGARVQRDEEGPTRETVLCLFNPSGFVLPKPAVHLVFLVQNGVNPL